MGLQRFYAHPDNTFTWPNGAVGHRPGGPFDCLGPYAVVRNVPIKGTKLRVTAYASGYPDTFFSVPAACKVNARYIGGFFTFEKNAEYEDVLVFCPLDRFKDRLPKASLIEVEGN